MSAFHGGGQKVSSVFLPCNVTSTKYVRKNNESLISARTVQANPLCNDCDFMMMIRTIKNRNKSALYSNSNLLYNKGLGSLLLVAVRYIFYTFLSNVICCRPSVCRLSVCLSVTLVHPTQAVVISRNISTAFGIMAIH